MKRDRVVMDPKQRKEQFISAAQALFEEKGYENTSVEDIVNRMSVAKGLFYYYFDSKEELLECLIKRSLDEVEGAMANVVARRDLDAMEKLRLYIVSSRTVRARSQKLVAYFHEDRNQALHSIIESRGTALAAPPLEQIIAQGCEEGIFDVKYPEDTALIYLAGASAISHERGANNISPREIQRRIMVFQDFSERLLGAAPGTFGWYMELSPKGLETPRRRPHGKS